MVTVDQAIIAKLAINGKHFEVLVDPNLAYDLKEGRSVSVQKMLAVNDVFSDSKKGVRVSPSSLQEAFQTTDVEKIAADIVKRGDVQLTTEFRRKKVEERRLQIASLVSKYAINPQTRMPHPQERVMNAMEQARYSVDPFKSAEQQVEDVIKAIKAIMPISVEEITLEVEIPAQYSGRVYGMLKEFNMSHEQWLTNGGLSAKWTIPAGMKEAVMRKIAGATAGSATIEESKK